MRKIISLGLFALLISILSNSVFADPADSLCDGLKAKEVTKGLFGLCVAFHNAGEDRGKLLEKYNSKKQLGDPDMPMEGECTCWSMDQITAASGPQVCINSRAYLGEWDTIIFNNAQFYAGDIFDDGVSMCGYSGSSTEIDETVLAQCIKDIATMAGVYFSEGCSQM